jgi:hypothetical protein
VEQHQLDDGLERVLDSDPRGGHRFVEGCVVAVERGVQVLDRAQAWEVALVELDHVRHVRQPKGVPLEVLLQVLERLHVRVQHRFLGVGHEDDPIRPLEHELARLVVEDLARHRVELHARLHAADVAEVDGEEVEEEGSVRLGGQGEHLALHLVGKISVDVLEVGGLSTETGAVVDDLRREFLGRIVEQHHGRRSSPPPAGARSPGRT